MRRRDLLGCAVRASVFTVAAPMINRGRFQLFAGTRAEYSARAIELLGRSTVVDMLGLLTMDWNKLNRWQSDPGTFSADDLQKLRSSRIDVFHPAVDLDNTDAFSTTKNCLDRWNGFITQQAGSFTRIDSAADLRNVRATGKIGILLGTQNSRHFRSAEDVAFFYSQGQRISQLTYNARNAIGCGCVERPDEGLTEFGQSIVAAMNSTGMLIDVSHAGEQTTLDTLEESKKPVLITHSNCRALVSHPRCKSDDVLRAVAANGGVFGITSIKAFVSARSTATIENVLDHYDHVMRVAGVEHLGVGSDTGLDSRDADGSRKLRLDIAGLNHPRRMFDLTEGLIRRRYSDASISAILGGNFLRVLDAAHA